MLSSLMSSLFWKIKSTKSNWDWAWNKGKN